MFTPADVFRGFPEVEEVILFGSRAMGTFRGNSDIDLAVKGKALGLRDAIRVREKLEELPMPFKIDVMEFGSVSNAALIEQIVRHGEVLFIRKDCVERVSDGGYDAYGEDDSGRN